MRYLLDTNVISESVKKNPNKNVGTFISSLSPTSAYISVLTLGELRKGIAKIANNDAKKQKLTNWLEFDLNDMFVGRVLNIDRDIADKWGFIMSTMKPQPPVVDSLIAATALTYNLILVTRNTKDYDRFNIEIINPWL